MSCKGEVGAPGCSELWELGGDTSSRSLSLSTLSLSSRSLFTSLTSISRSLVRREAGSLSLMRGDGDDDDGGLAGWLVSDNGGE